MVFGNLGLRSGSGVGFTRNPASGEPQLYVDFLVAAQGEDVVGGRVDARGGAGPTITAMAGLARQLEQVSARLEALFGDAQDFEFTVEDGHLWLLQTRRAHLTPLADLRITCALVDEGRLTPSEALERLRAYDLDTIGHRRLADVGRTAVGVGTPAGSGVAHGRVALSIEQARDLSRRGDPVILLRDQATTDDIAGLAVCAGMVTRVGARTSHAAVVARHLGVVVVVGCDDLIIDLPARTASFGEHRLSEGDELTVDGDRGLVFVGELETIVERPVELIERAHAWGA
jgi:pyruvate,orthophosphate dikinase